MKKKRNAILITKAAALTAALCLMAAGFGMAARAEAKERTRITLLDGDIRIEGAGASADGNTLSISQAGTYVITGSLTSGQIIVSAGKDAGIELELDGAAVTNPSGAALFIESADKVKLDLQEGTVNTLTSGVPVPGSILDASADDEASGAALQSKDDLTIKGKGTLYVYGYLNNGIQSGDDIRINGGTVYVFAVNNGIRGNDSVQVSAGSVSVTCAGNGIATRNAKDGKGDITVEGGEIAVEAGQDGMEAEASVRISGGTVMLVTGGGSAAAEKVRSSSGMWGQRGARGWDMSSESAGSAKGIKAERSIVINGGTISVDSRDDGIHAASVQVSGADVTISAGDDGIHGDESITVTSGTIGITESYEGIEAVRITIDGGVIRVKADDDGLNANGGDERGRFAGNPDTNFTINGGDIYVLSAGDGLDSNGTLVVNGGTVVVDGPSDNGNGALDYGTYSTITGGTVFAIGGRGMAVNFGDSSTQCAFLTDAAIRAGSTITISDSSGNVLFTHTAAKSASSLVFSCPELELGGTYTITVDGDVSEITLTSLISGESYGMGGMWGPGGFGGRPGMPEGPGGRNEGFRGPQGPGREGDPGGGAEGQPGAPEGQEPSDDTESSLGAVRIRKGSMI